MKKILLAALCVAMAAPAFAKDHALNGYFRTRMIVAEQSFTDDADPDKLVDQRFRAKWAMGLNEYVTVTYFGEVDFQYGDTQYATGRNSGGAIGGDTVNLETKNLNLAVKIPETPVSATLGLQGFGDNWDGVWFMADMAGVKAVLNTSMVDVTGAWFKWEEGLVREGAAAPTSKGTPTIGGVAAEDDVDLWALQLALKPMGELKLGLDGYWLNMNGNQSVVGETIDGDLYYVGVNAAYKLPMVALKGWFLYNFGEVTASDVDVDVAGWAASLKGSFMMAGANLGLRGFYFSGDSDDDSDAEFMVNTQPGESFFFYEDNLMIMVADVFGNSYFQNGFAATDGAYAGNGLWGATLSGGYVPPAMKQVYGKFGIGYFSTTDGEDNGAEGDVLGTEVALRVGYKMAEVVDLSLNGAYAILGDFYDDSTPSKDDGTPTDPDNPYMFYAMVNVNY